VANEKRQRQKEARRERVDEIARLERHEVVRQRALLVILIVALVGGAIFLLSRDTDADNTFDPLIEGADAAPTTIDPAAEEAAAELVDQINRFVPPAAGASITGDTPCPAEDSSSERTTSFENAPPMCIDPTAAYTAVMTTDAGDITIELDAAAAPETVNNFVVLARYGYYEGVPFHRIIPGFVIQGGDAVGGGDPGNPGYAIDDELPEEGAYQIGSVAMANSGPNTNGSQFFIITGDDGASLPPSYSLFGQVIDGEDVVTGLDEIGSPGAGVPSEVVRIQSVTITEG
jgi:cyclophilin family peptidyl-prolyl cis-trans isomerase